MNESRTVARPERAARSNLSTRSAPGSSLRIASTAEVSRTSRDASAISPSVPLPLLEEPAYRAPLARPAKGGDGIVGNRDDAHGVSLDDPLQRGVRRDAQLSPDSGGNGDLPAVRHPRTHRQRSIMRNQVRQGTIGMHHAIPYPSAGAPGLPPRARGGRWSGHARADTMTPSTTAAAMTSTSSPPPPPTSTVARKR